MERNKKVLACSLILLIGLMAGASLMYEWITYTNSLTQSQTPQPTDLTTKTLAAFYVSPYEASHNFTVSGFAFTYVGYVNGSGTLTYLSTNHTNSKCGTPLVVTVWGYKASGTVIGYNPPSYVNNGTAYTVYSVNVQFDQAFVPIKYFHVGDALSVYFYFLPASKQTPTLMEAYEPLLLIFTEAPNQTVCVKGA